MQAAGKKELPPRQTHTPQTDRAGPRGVNATQAVNSLWLYLHLPLFSLVNINDMYQADTEKCQYFKLQINFMKAMSKKEN